MTSKILYHVTFTRNVPAIRNRGILTFQTTNWIKAGNKKRYGSGEIYAFEHENDALAWASKMDWAHHQKVGSGKISVIQFSTSLDWEIDTADPLNQALCTGKWLKSRQSIGPESLLNVKPFNMAAAKELVAHINQRASAH